MKDIMKEVEGKVKFSMADSTTMLLVQQAMDKAHEKIKTKHGLLLRLNAISLFYELAVLQLESCLQLVQQETGKLESNHEEVVRDLREIKDRLHHRLLETELAILEKDRELLEMSKNQESLRNVLESKETELVHLQDLERKRCHNKIGKFIKEDEFSELKSSVDQQVMNLRQKLETEYDELRGETEDPSGVDIDVLKGTMDLAFNKMHHAIFLSELGPIEQSWRWSIERESMSLLIKGFLNGLEEKKNKIVKLVMIKKKKRKSQELAPPKIEPVKRQKSSSSKRAIDDVVAGLDSLMSLNTTLFEHLFDNDDSYDKKEVGMDDNLDDVWMKMQKSRSVFSDNAIEEKEDAEMKLMILEDTYLTLLKELLKDVSETVENHEKSVANNKKMTEEEGKRAFLGVSLSYDDFDFKIQEKLKMVSFRLQNLEIKIRSMMDCVAELRRKESVYRTAFVLRSKNLIKAEAEVDLLGDQVDSLVKLLKKTLLTVHQHPSLLSNNSDISEISKMIKKELSYEEDSS
ncbi:hypothetical protein AALP_AA8G153000 [Arabis alpina]|uniref:WPP domain-associated protein n=1 Tax=Arabis alpina TaxID=50452 RepID=A0A087G785_ARAAL|nr:hypothetical protein AALP_AA8G153000 [Arabis alpina]